MEEDVHTVLVVDDDTAVRRTITRCLAIDGFKAIEAGNGQAALAYLRSGGAADVIVLDLHMPLMDGWTFRREQRGDPALARIPVIILSDQHIHESPEMGTVLMFHKPARLSALIGCVRRLCEDAPTPQRTSSI